MPVRLFYSQSRDSQSQETFLSTCVCVCVRVCLFQTDPL